MTLAIWTDLSADELREQARKERNGRASQCMLTVVNALDGMGRADAARVVGMEL